MATTSSITKKANSILENLNFIICKFYISPQPSPQASIKAAVANPLENIQ